MKKQITVLALLLVLGSSAALATDDSHVDKAVLASFQKEFTDAKNVSWSREQDYYKAVFTLGDTRVIAFYTLNGEFAGSARNLMPGQLPLVVTQEIGRRYGTPDLLEVTEISNDAGTSYKILIQTGGKRVKLSAYPSGEIIVEKKFQK
ncbi:MAG TPA: hypothetical protein VG870_03110 [Chitinophagaceae bacterium]|nr:hypothetical protein [Chitinophagaceae bacterium]